MVGGDRKPERQAGEVKGPRTNKCLFSTSDEGGSIGKTKENEPQRLILDVAGGIGGGWWVPSDWRMSRMGSFSMWVVGDVLEGGGVRQRDKERTTLVRSRHRREVM